MESRIILYRSISKTLFCFLFLFSLFLSNYSFASDSKNHYIYLSKIEKFLNNIKNLSSDFTQIHEGQVSRGKFYISRPGKMRVEYSSEPKLLITVNGSVLTYKDLELDEVANLSTNTTPASLLTRKNISFKAKDISIERLTIGSDYISVTVLKKNNPEAGKFRLFFDKEITKFEKMEIVDDLNQTITVKLSNIKRPAKLSNNLFYIKSSNLPF